MQRRKFLIGLGSLAAGGAAATGSGAFSAMSASRESDINVVTDDQGLVALRPGDAAGDRVYLTDGGELKIDFTSDEGGQGVNVNSRYQIGYFGQFNWMGPEEKLPTPEYPGDPHHLPAFSVVNQDTESHSVTLAYEFSGDPGDSKMYMMGASRSAETVDSASNIPKQSTWLPGEISFKNHGAGQPGDIRLESGGRVGVSLFIDTRDGSPDDDLSGTLTVSSN
jgi:hypothetical protein